MLKLASYEAIKAGASPDGTSEDAERVFNLHASALGIKSARLALSKNKFDNASTGEFLNVRGVANAKSNRFPAPISLDLNRVMSGGAVWYRKEGL